MNKLEMHFFEFEEIFVLKFILMSMYQSNPQYTPFIHKEKCLCISVN